MVCIGTAGDDETGWSGEMPDDTVILSECDSKSEYCSISDAVYESCMLSTVTSVIAEVT